MDGSWARDRIASARVARLASVDAEQRPHLVPIVFVVIAEVVYSAVDAKPKSTHKLRRLDNIAHNPAVSLLVDHYCDEWEELWWARADGSARILDIASPEARTAMAGLRDRYPQYRTDQNGSDQNGSGGYGTEPLPGPVLAIDVARWSGWVFR
jgi:PPOX class probable F420-dependent enzyme